MSANRLFEIVYLLLEKKRLTAGELAARFEVSVRTIYRDVDALSAAGVPIYATQGKGGGVALMEHYVLDRAAFTEEEQRQLLTALQSLPENARGGGSDVSAKLSGLFRRQEADWLQVNLSRWGSGTADSRKFAALKNAILERTVIRFGYVSSYGQSTDRTAYPARLVFKGQGWYLQAYCPDKEDYRTFKLSRVLRLTALDEHFDLELTPPPIETEGPPPTPLCAPICLRFSPAMAYRVYDEFDESCVSRLEDGALLAKAAFPDDGWLYGYLLSFGTGVEVVEPQHVRERLGALAKEIWQQSGKPDTPCQVTTGMLEPSKQREVPAMETINQKFCQSCGMPLNERDDHGTEADGSTSEHYCKYCYEKGSFTSEMTMEEMIAFCATAMAQGNSGMSEDEAKAQMHQFFPMLLRWKKD